LEKEIIIKTGSVRLDLIRKLGIVTKNKQSKKAIELFYRRIILRIKL